MVIVLPWEQTPLGMEMDLEPLSLPTYLEALRISIHCDIRADLMQTRGHLLPPCVWVQGLEGCYLPACVSAPQVLLGHRGHASVCVSVSVSVSVRTLVPPTLHSATSRPPSCRTAVPFTSPTCQGTRRRASPCGISVRHGLCDFFGEQCLAVWTQVARLQCHPERNFLSVRSDPEMACAALGERARALS